MHKGIIKTMTQYYYVEIENLDKSVSPKAKLYDLHSNTLQITKLEKKVAFCIPEGVCNVCYETFFEEFINYSKIIGEDNLIILVPKSKLREMFVELGVNAKKINIQIYGVESSELGLDLFNKSSPFMFVLDKDLRAKNLHIHNLNSPNLTDEYLRIVKNKYFLPIRYES
ncbi:hypothetical protein [Spirosoma fluviale]|nr:hypothetical protein [Spirosoma fluviale]